MTGTDGTSPVLLLGGVVALILVAVVIFIATLLYIQRAQSDKQVERKQAELPATAQPEPRSVLSAQGAEPAPSASLLETPARPGEVMRVIRDERSGRVLIEVEGQQYAHIREIEDARTGRRVLWAIADLLRFTGGMAANPQAVRSASQQVSQDLGDTRPQGAARPEDVGGPAEEKAAGQVGLSGTQAALSAPGPAVPAPPLGEMPAPAAASSRPVQPRTRVDTSSWAGGGSEQPGRRRYNLIEFFRRGIGSPSSAVPMPSPGSFIDEIEAILQDHIRRRPTPLPYEVHVTTGPDSALQIEVDRSVYSSSDEVPDPEVRELIRAAVAEWERR